MSPAPCAKSSSSGSGKVRYDGATACSANPPNMHIAATRSPVRTDADSGADSTTPATSLPGTNGTGGFSWYMPRVCSTSGNATPAAWTSISTWSSPGCGAGKSTRSEEHTSELQSRQYLVCRLLLEKKKKITTYQCLTTA